MLDLEAKEGGDRLLGNGASIPVELAGTQYVKDPTGDNPDDHKPEDNPPEENDEEGGKENE